MKSIVWNVTILLAGVNIGLSVAILLIVLLRISGP